MSKRASATKREPKNKECGDTIGRDAHKNAVGGFSKDAIQCDTDETKNESERGSARNVVRDAFQYSMKQGDLFSCSEDHSLAHCISADIRLGKGIAVLFRNKFGGIDDLKKQGANTGQLAVLKRGSRFIYNLVTKDKYWQKPTYNTLESSLKCMKQHCQKNNVGMLAMPMIGCGLDGLDWTKVEKLIHEVFIDTDISITVYRL